MKWISVKDRLPEYGKKVVVCNVNERKQGMLVLKREQGMSELCDSNDFRTNNWISEVSHWGIPSKSDWISVDDRLPHSERAVLVQSSYEELTFNHRTYDKGIQTDKHQFCVFWGQDEEVKFWCDIKMPRKGGVKQLNNYQKHVRLTKEQADSEEFISQLIKNQKDDL